MIRNFRIKVIEGNSRFKYREGRIVKIDIEDIATCRSLVLRYLDDSCFVIFNIKEVIDDVELRIIAEGQIYVLEKI